MDKTSIRHRLVKLKKIKMLLLRLFESFFACAKGIFKKYFRGYLSWRSKNKFKMPCVRKL